VAEFLAQLPSGQQEVQAEAWLLSAQCSLAMYDNSRAEDELFHARTLFTSLGRHEAALYCELLAIRFLLDAREFGLARDKAKLLLEIVVNNGWRNAEALARGILGLVHFHSRQHNHARSEIEQALVIEDRFRLDWQYYILQMTLAGCLAGLGDFAASQQLYDESFAALSPLPVPRAKIMLLGNEAYRACLEKNFEHARQCYTATLEASEIEGVSSDVLAWFRTTARHNLGLVELELGNYAEAKRQLLRAWNRLRELNCQQLACSCMTALSIIALLDDDPDSAVHYAQTSKREVTVYGEIESLVVDYFLAVAYLGAGAPYDASFLWEHKAELEVNTETRQFIDWLLRELDHILADEYREIVPLAESARALAQQWKQELTELAEQA
jgi:tetratricopeptide (TPR) repeat protein